MSKWIFRLASLAAAAVLGLAASSAHAIWTHAVSACVVDDDDVAEYAAGTTILVHRAGVTGNIVTRCNVVDVDFGPGSTSLQLVYVDPDGPATAYSVTARLRSIANTGASTTIATVSSNAGPASAAQQLRSVGFNHVFDFYNNAYIVEVIVTRFDTLRTPSASIVRIVGVIE